MVQFQQPSQAGQFKAEDYRDRLVLITVREKRDGIVTAFGAADAIAADVVVLDGPGAPEEIENALIFGKVLYSTLGNAVGGDPVLGRIGQGVAKAGQSAPWVMTPFTDADAQIAMSYINSRPKPFQAAPQSQQQAPAQQGWAQQQQLAGGATYQQQQQAPAPMHTLPNGQQVDESTYQSLVALGAIPAAG